MTISLENICEHNTFQDDKLADLYLAVRLSCHNCGLNIAGARPMDGYWSCVRCGHRYPMTPPQRTLIFWLENWRR